MAKLVTTVGTFVGLLSSIRTRARDGRLLLRRRTEEGSILPGISFMGNWELPGGSVQETERPRYDHLVLEALREIEEEVGIKIAVDPEDDSHQIFSMYAAQFKGSQGYDLSVVIPMIYGLEPTKGETCWVSPEELNQLAQDFVSVTDAKKQGLSGAQGIVSGWGKRMHWMSLCALTHSPNLKFVRQAQLTIADIQEDWV